MEESEQVAMDSRRRKTGRLALDNVVGSQPELGPAPPDGGYGWIIVFGITIIQVTIPSVVVTSGLLIQHILNDTSTISTNSSQWIWLPAIFYAAWSITDPWSITLTSVLNSCCMAATGVVFVTSALVAASLINSNIDIIYMALGLLAGIGASLVTTQSEFLLQKYFRSRLPLVHSVYNAGRAVGEIIMPVLVGYLINQFGLSSTLLLQAGIILQALIGAILFRKPEYVGNAQSAIKYSLLQNEETNESNETAEAVNNIPEHTENQTSHNVEPYRDTDTSDDEPISIEMEPKNTADIPQPLFSEVDLTSNSQNMAVFIEDSEDDIDLFVQRGGYTKRNLPFTHEIKVLTYPSFHIGLFLIAVTKLSALAFWILLPFLLVLRFNDFLLYKTMLMLSIGGIANMCSIIVCHWLPSMTARNRKIICIASSYVAAAGLSLLSISYSWIGVVWACILVRLGTGGVTNAFRHVLKDAMGDSEVIKTQTLLQILCGLLMLLGMMLISKDFETSFKILAGMNLAAGTLWGLQPILNRLCCSVHR